MRPEDQFQANLEVRHAVARLAIAGELDMNTVEVLNENFATIEQNGTKAIVLDLRDLAFLDSSGLKSLLHAKERADKTGRHFFVMGASTSARRLFETTGTEFLLDDEQAAQVLKLFIGNGSSNHV